jgi:hypothetical protein
MKRVIRIGLALGGVAIFLLLFGNTWDYGFSCTRCLYYEHRIQHRLCGITVWESTMNRHNQYGEVYGALFQQPCTHVMKTGGFGHNPGCGMTAEGLVFGGRNKAVKALFEAYQRNSNAALTRESLALVEQLFPERMTVEDYYRMQREQTNAPNCGNMVMYGEWMDVVETTDEWQRVNEVARQNFATLPEFLRDGNLMRSKLNSPSLLVREAATNWLKFPPKPE